MLATISGSATSESIAEAAKKERPKTMPSVLRLRKPSAVLEKITVPNRASTIEGMPAIASIVDSVIRASAVGRPYSTSQTAIAMPGRQRDRDPHRGHDHGPEEGVGEAAAFALAEAAGGRASPASRASGR